MKRLCIWVFGIILPRCFTKSLVELELVDKGCKVAHIPDISGNMKLCSRVKVFLASLAGWNHTWNNSILL